MVTSWYHGSLPFAQTTWVKILCTNIKPIKLLGEQPVQSISKSVEQTEKSRQIDLPQITAHINLLSLAPHTEYRANHLIF